MAEFLVTTDVSVTANKLSAAEDDCGATAGGPAPRPTRPRELQHCWVPVLQVRPGIPVRVRDQGDARLQSERYSNDSAGGTRIGVAVSSCPLTRRWRRNRPNGTRLPKSGGSEGRSQRKSIDLLLVLGTVVPSRVACRRRPGARPALPRFVSRTPKGSSSAAESGPLSDCGWAVTATVLDRCS